MESEDNFLENSKYSKLTNDLISNDILLLDKNIETNTVQRNSFYIGGNSHERKLEKSYHTKKELESQKNLTKNKSIKETELCEDEKDSSLIKSMSYNNDIQNLKIKKDIINELPFNLNITKSSDCHKKIMSTINSEENEQISHSNSSLNNNTNTINENEEIIVKIIISSK